MKWGFTILFVLVFFFELPARHDTIDSLYSLLEESDEAESFEVYDALFKELINTGKDSAKSVATKMLNLAKEVENLEFIGRSYMNLGVFYNKKANQDSVEYHFQLALELFDQISESQFKVNTLVYFGNSLINSNTPRAMQYYERGLDIARSIRDSVLISSCYLNLANVFSLFGDQKAALKNRFNALEIKNALNQGRPNYSSAILLL